MSSNNSNSNNSNNNCNINNNNLTDPHSNVQSDPLAGKIGNPDFSDCATTPESIQTRLKNSIFHILHLPVSVLEHAKVWIENEAGKLELVIKVEEGKIKADWDKFKNHDFFSSDAVNENTKQHEYRFSVPPVIKNEVKHLATLTNTTNPSELAMVGRHDQIDKALTSLETKVASSGKDDNVSEHANLNLKAGSVSGKEDKCGCGSSIH